MGRYDLNDITPFKVFYVGEFLSDEIAARGIKQRELAVQTGINVSVLNEILKSKRGINTDYAVAFESALGIPAEMLMKLQSAHNRNSASTLAIISAPS